MAASLSPFHQEVLSAVLTHLPSTPFNAYDALNSLPMPRRQSLVGRLGLPGKGCGRHYSSACAVMMALRALANRGLIRVARYDHDPALKLTLSLPGVTHGFTPGNAVHAVYEVV